jgi:thiol-disulfide isomerase/thioredoxin
MQLRYRILAATALVLSCLLAQAQKPNSAQEILSGAKTRAGEQHKLVFLEFSASWCKPCHMLDGFLAAPEIAPILQKYFVFAKVHIDEKHGQHPELDTPGGAQLMQSFAKPQGVPYLVFLEANGKTIVNSEMPEISKNEGGNIGYPEAPEEIDWFMAMLHKSVPEMTADETHKIEDWLRNAARKK